jgi:hypothetical protein
MKKKDKQSGGVRLLVVLALVAGTIVVTGGLAHADQSLDWNKKNGATACDPGTTGTVLWIFSPHSDAIPTALYINGVQATGTGWQQQGNGSWHFTADIPGQFSNITSASVTYTGDLGNNPVFTISGCNETTPQTASITIDKTIPNVLQGNETVTFTFQALLSNVVVGACDITFIAGQTQGFCTIGNLQPNTTYTIHEVPNPPWATLQDVQVTAGAGGSDTSQSFVNSFGPATAEACKVTDVDSTGFDSTGSQFIFDLKADGTKVESVTVTIGTSKNGCESFATSLQEGVKYTIVEETPAAGWTPDAGVCTVNGNGPVSDFTPNFPGDADALFSCTFTNSIRAAHATVAKVTIPAGTEAGFTFHLLAGGVDTGATATSTGTGALNFTPNVDLQDGVLYTVTEDARAGYQSDGGSGCSFTPSYPADSGKTFACVFTNTKLATATVRKVTIPAGSEAGWTFDLFKTGVVNPIATVTTTNANAVDFGVFLTAGSYTVVEHSKPNWSSNGGVGCSFTVAFPANAGQVFNCVFTNTHVSQGLTIGYWKTHLTFDSKHPLAPYTAKYLPQYLGTYKVDTTAKATAVFNANCGSTTSQNAIGCLAAQLLAAELNVANGADPCANAIIAKANSFLSGGTVDGVTGVNYTGPTGNYSTITAAQRAKAISLKTALDTYNNGTCPV